MHISFPHTPLSLPDWGVVIRENTAGGPSKGNPVAVKEQIKWLV
jgi:hypothetical protein